MTGRDDLRFIPSVDEAVRHLEAEGVLDGRPRSMVVRAVRAALEEERGAILGGREPRAGSEAEVRRAILELLGRAVERASMRNLMAVVNATGVVVHTNLGRAPLSGDAIEAVAAVSRAYSNLEYDLVEGRRGKRDLLVRDALCELTGAEDALVVNNNAAAVMLALNTLAVGREVVISRSELIEIGGSFRLPEVFEKSGSRMVEVGSTNRTHLADFEAAIRSSTGAIMSAHWSNYEIVGFVERVSLRELAELGARVGVPVIHDLGSGILVDTAQLGIPGEMTVAESVKAGATVSTFSGDKLLGGPQAGIAVGSVDVIARMRSNPLTRALRPGKLTLAALQATLTHYLDGTALEKVPVLAAITTPVDELAARAEAMVGSLAAGLGDRADVTVTEITSRVGGGAAPEREIPSRGVDIAPKGVSAATIVANLLEVSPPVIVRTREDRIILDLRTVSPSDDDFLGKAILEAFGGS